MGYKLRKTQYEQMSSGLSPKTDIPERGSSDRPLCAKSGRSKKPSLGEYDRRPTDKAAIEGLILVAELGGPTMFARIGIMWALNRGHVREFDTSRKDTHWGRRKLKRDQ